ncbi:MAG TPA: FHA domain-containing protein [Xanthomonadales bacterium]|nr:FHA domain-containing protein [Xanthomonadales bacterium]
MALDLNTIDLSAVEALAAIKTEHDQLGERLRAMANKRDQVSAEVYQRVHADYRKRLDELALQAAPLKQRAGEVYRALRDELAGLEDAFANARLDREEIDFRHSLGEFDASELQQRVKAVDVRIEEHGKARTQAQALKERFLAVVSAETELEANDDDTARMNAISVPAPEASATVIAQPLKPGAAFDGGATMVAPLPSMPPAVEAAPPAPPVASPAPDPGAAPAPPRQAARAVRNPDATVVFRQGRLEPRNPEAGSVVQTLGLKPISIGSDATCDLQLSAPGIAKRHVEITMTRAGFCLRDCAASGSVKINGAVVQEHVLAEGDTLLVASAQFNFRLL